MAATQKTQLIIYKPSVVGNGFFQDTSTVTREDGGTQDWEQGVLSPGTFNYFPGYAEHVAGAAASLSQDDVAWVGLQYRVKVTVSNMGVGSVVFVQFGGFSTQTILANGDYTYTMTADTKRFDIEVTSTFGGKISKVSVVPIPTDYFIDLQSQVNIPLNFSIADIRNPDKRTTTYSKTVTIPGTKHNNQIFGEIFEISGDGTYNPNKVARAVVIEDGIEIFDGNIQLTNILRNQSGYNDYDLIQYEINLLGKLVDFFSKIQDDFLTDLDFSEYTHIYTISTSAINPPNVQSSWNGAITKNGALYNTFTNTLTASVTSVTFVSTPTGNRVRLDFSAPHSYVLTDYLNVGLSNPSNQARQLNGFHTIYSIPNNTSIILNYGSASLTNPTSFATATGVVQKVVTSGEGYVYPMIDYDGSGNSYLSSGWNINKMYPSIYLKNYIDKIFAKAGYSYDSDFFNSDFFKRLIVPYANAGDPLMMSEDDITNRKFKALQTTIQSGTLTSPITVFAGQPATMPYSASNFGANSGYITSIMPNDNVIPGMDPGGVYNNSTNRFVVTTLTANKYDLYWSSSFDFYITTNMAGYAAGGPSSSTIYNLTFEAQMKVVAGPSAGTVLATASTSVGIATTSLQSFSLSATNKTLVPGDQVEVQFKFTVPSTTWVSTPGSGVYFPSPINFSYDVANAVFYNNLTSTAISVGSTLNPNACIPKKIKTKDFFIDLIRMFNLYIQQDKLNEKVLIIEPRPDFYSKTDIVDWTDKLDISQQLEIKPVGDLNGKIYTYTYKEDKDFLNDDHQKENGHTYGYQQTIIDNDFINQNVDTKLTVFSPTPIAGPTQFYSAKPNYFLSFMAKGPSFAATTTNIRLLFYGMRGVESGQQWNLTDGISITIPLLFYPYAGHLDNVFGPTIDLNFGYPDEVYYSFSTWTNNNLYNKFYSDFIFEITNKNSKVITAQIKLDPYDIFDLDFRRLYLIDGHYLRLNKITDYSVATDGMTQCEFLKAESGVQPLFSADSIIGISSGFVLTELGSDARIFSASNELGGDNLVPALGDSTARLGTGNTIGSGTGIEVIGNDNYVGFDVANILIKGSNNIVMDGLSDITIINTDNITVTESNQTWVNGMYFSSGGASSNLSVNYIEAGINQVLSPFNLAKLTSFIDAGSDVVINYGGAELIHIVDGGADEIL